MVTAFAIAVGIMIGGLVIVAAGIRGVFPTKEKRAKAASNPAVGLGRVALALAGFVLAYLATGWLVAAVYAAVAGAVMPTFLLAKRKRRESVERIEAIASWVETLRDTMAASAGVQEALITSASIAPKPVEAEVQALAVRLQHEPPTSALRRFAADVQHPLADMVVASLVLALSRQAGSLQTLLSQTAKTARDYAAMWRNVEGGRSRLYAQARLVATVSFLAIAWFVFANREFLQPYDSPTGQFALAIVLGAFFLSGAALYRMTLPKPMYRPFQGIEQWSPTQPVGGGEVRP